MKKTETEISKAVRALHILHFMSSSNFYRKEISPEDWVAGFELSTKLVPSTSKNPEDLVKFDIVERTDFEGTIVHKDFIRVPLVSDTVYKFVEDIRREFTSIHDFNKGALEFKTTTLSTPEDVEWAKEVRLSYGQPWETSYMLVGDINPESDTDRATMILDISPLDDSLEEVVNQLKMQFELIGECKKKFGQTKEAHVNYVGTLDLWEY